MNPTLRPPGPAWSGSPLLHRTTRAPAYERWYRTFWGYAERRMVDRTSGSWWHELDEHGQPAFTIWDGKPDLYHVFQATLFARAPQHQGLAEAARQGRIACRARPYPSWRSAAPM
ncbi:AGE family epimerase/isomerase [Streptomyces sp. MZ04]|uniref:AGE family epimerase/isomerase n=1 Tax=Streptomyces sp. MZ04 TaxID=2559236 RepID=UPI00107EAE2A|nr:AGE family epimerase/isomerase [Streptomyces sp. MZ04]TGB07306.1 hypothetical protein E2651_22080 [Streptomyces sp. MZ04]